MKAVKMWVHVLWRRVKDALSNDIYCHKRQAAELSYMIELKQPFTASATLAEKKHNLQLAADHIRQYVVMPGEVFSLYL